MIGRLSRNMTIMGIGAVTLVLLGASLFPHPPVIGAEAAFPGNWDMPGDDFELHPVPKLPKQEKGKPFVDPVTRLSVTRLTDPEADGYGGGHPRAFAGYLKYSIENCDRTYLALLAGGGTRRCGATYRSCRKS